MPKNIYLTAIKISLLSLIIPLFVSAESWEDFIGTDEKIDTNLECQLSNGKDTMKGVVPGSQLPVSITLTRKDNGKPMTNVKVNYSMRGVDGHKRVATDSQGKAVANFLLEKTGPNVLNVSFYAGDPSVQGGAYVSQCDLNVSVEDDISQLNNYIRTHLGAEHLHKDIWQYYAERLTTQPDSADRINTFDELKNVMKYWSIQNPNKPRGLTQAEHAAREKSPSFRSQLNQTSREVFGSNPTFNQWKYWVTRIDNGEIVDLNDLRNKMTYHRNYFQVHGQYP